MAADAPLGCWELSSDSKSPTDVAVRVTGHTEEDRGGKTRQIANRSRQKYHVIVR